MTGEGELPPRMRVPVTVTVCRLVAAGAADLSGAFFGCVLAGALVTRALPCMAVSVVVFWAMAHSLVPVMATSKAMEMALRSVLVFMLRPLLSPDWRLADRCLITGSDRASQRLPAAS
ncbi:hypothetical protein UUC_11024 [Rhodanobacter denitrificans]|nr:hypothetical protein UUC_11024 [Rhodanobacter denitrificans]